jgi:hypothetical protein
MDDKKVTEDYKNILQDYLDHLTEMLNVVTRLFSDGAYYTIEPGLCENIHRIMDDKKVTEEYKNILHDYLDRLTEMLNVVTLLFSDGDYYTIEPSRLIPFGLLRGLTENYDENELEHVVIPGSRENFLVLLAFIEEENEVRRAGLIRAFRGPDTYHHNTARLGESLLDDANKLALPSASLAELYRLVNLETNTCERR